MQHQSTLSSPCDPSEGDIQEMKKGLCNPFFLSLSPSIIPSSVYLYVACRAGQFGENCLQTCVCGGAPCDPVTGQCICPVGKTGKACQQGS